MSANPDTGRSVADLHDQARADYGTPAERAQRAADGREQRALARIHGAEAAGTERRTAR